MKNLFYLSLLLQLLFYLHAVVRAGPILINNSDDLIDDVEVDDEFTTQTVERLSSAATCLVASVEYTHGQQIYRADPCEFCLCLDGEMFCWWQDCPPALEGPCKDKRPFTSCQASENENAIDSASHSSPSASSRREASIPITTTSTINATASSTSSPSQSVETNSNLASQNSETLVIDNNNNSSGGQVSTSAASAPAIAGPLIVDVTTGTPKRCSIMGRSYNIGDRLPHNTGNCVECICGAGAQIVCSPHQCAPSVDDINDYRPAGLRSGQPDVF